MYDWPEVIEATVTLQVGPLFHKSGDQALYTKQFKPIIKWLLARCNK